MGYTHYWTPKVAEPKKWKEFVKTCKTLHKALPEYTDTAGGYCEDEELEICGGGGTGKPKFTNKEVWFNGNEDKGLDHETLYLAPDKLDWNFCKTARKPYDLLVVAVLIAAHDILDYEVSSDGNWDDWKPGVNFYFDTLYVFENTKKGMEEATEIMEYVLPDFLVEEQEGTNYYKYENKYSIGEWIKSFFMPIHRKDYKKIA